MSGPVDSLFSEEFLRDLLFSGRSGHQCGISRDVVSLPKGLESRGARPFGSTTLRKGRDWLVDQVCGRVSPEGDVPTPFSREEDKGFKEGKVPMVPGVGRRGGE